MDKNDKLLLASIGAPAAWSGFDDKGSQGLESSCSCYLLKLGGRMPLVRLLRDHLEKEHLRT